MASWEEILPTLAELTGDRFRAEHADSFGGPYRFNWFVLDFTGFRTNPKERVARYHDTYDQVRSLPVEPDGLGWHYHAPPPSGEGDQWSASWLGSNEHNTILARRLIEREHFPEAFRAGGTIEDESASRWLEEVFLLDLSNRVSERSRPGADLFHFNWWGAPAVWGSYHPKHGDFLRPGSMRRVIYRSLDLRSRYNVVSRETIEACFRDAEAAGAPRVLSFFSHDNRDMRPETYDVYRDLQDVSASTGIPWRSCTAADAHRRYHLLESTPIALSLGVDGGRVVLETDAPPFQRLPFTAAELDDGRFVRLYPRPETTTSWVLDVEPGRVRRVGAAVTSPAADQALVVRDLDGRS